jgi:HEAT repeat protein
MARKSKDLLAAFVEALQKQNDFLAGRGGSVRSGNQQARKYSAAARKLLAGGQASIDRFATLLDHPDRNVRAMAAAFLLKDRTEQAVATLRPIAEGPGLSALGAIYTLKRYEIGDLEIK